MMFSEYRKIKAKKIGNFVIKKRRVLYERTQFDPLTGDAHTQKRDDIVELEPFLEKRQKMAERLADLDEFINDLKAKINEIPPKQNPETINET